MLSFCLVKQMNIIVYHPFMMARRLGINALMRRRRRRGINGITVTTKYDDDFTTKTTTRFGLSAATGI